MREIKFRAWDKETGKWWYGSSECKQLDPETTIVPLSTFWILVEDGTLDIKTVGEYIGFKDKNGVEIYEGEKVTGNPYSRDGKIYGQSGCIDPLEIKIPDCYFLMEGRFYPEECEVIGNIYENKELLEVKQ